MMAGRSHWQKIMFKCIFLNSFELLVAGKKIKKNLPKFSIVPETVPTVSAPRDLDKRTNITIGEKVFEVEADDLEPLGLLGQGAYGIVEKMKHRITDTIMAVKVWIIIEAQSIFLCNWINCIEDTSNGEQSGTEATFDRSGRVDEDGRLPVHGDFLRGLVQGRWRLDLHGVHGHQPRQILHKSLPPRQTSQRRRPGKNRFCRTRSLQNWIEIVAAKWM